MKTKTSLFIFTFILSLTVISFNIHAQQRITSRNFNVPAFNAIESNTVGNIVFSQSANTSVVAEGDKEMIDALNVSVKNNVLVINLRENFFKRIRRRNRKLDFRISSPNLQRIESDGVGNITLRGKVRTPGLEISSNGVGNLTADNLECDRLTIDSDGVGNVTVAGRSNYLTINSDGVGNVKAEKLFTKYADVTSDGVGNVNFHASESMDVSSDGIGNVTYYGNPKTKNIRKDGIGKLRPGN